jgi:hypothetical protein
MTASPLRSRFQIVERPFANPGKCVVCGAVDRPCVDFGMDLDEYGAVYFCLDCMREGGLAAGLIHPKEYAKAKLGAEQSLRSYLYQRDLRLVYSEFVERLNSVLASISNAFPDTDFHLGNDDANPNDEKDLRGGQELFPVFEQSDSSSGQDDQSPSDSRPASISASTGFGDLFDPFAG